MSTPKCFWIFWIKWNNIIIKWKDDTFNSVQQKLQHKIHSTTQLLLEFSYVWIVCFSWINRGNEKVKEAGNLDNPTSPSPVHSLLYVYAHVYSIHMCCFFQAWDPFISHNFISVSITSWWFPPPYPPHLWLKMRNLRDEDDKEDASLSDV